MDLCPKDDRIARLIHAIRTANVRDSDYKVAERELLELGDAARTVLVGFLSDPDVVVRERATELLRKLSKSSGSTSG